MARPEPVRDPRPGGALPEPANLDAVEAQIGDRWDITSLLDVVVETLALRTGFLGRVPDLRRQG